MIGSPDGERRAEARAAAHLEHDRPQQALLVVDPGAGEGEPLHGEPGLRVHVGRGSVVARAIERHDGRERLEVLQPVELPGLELARRHGRVHHDLDDGRRQPVDLVHGRHELVVELREEGAPGGVSPRLRRFVERLDLREESDHVRVAVLRARHRLDDAAGVVRVVVAVERDRLAVLQVAREERRRRAGSRVTRPCASTFAACARKYCLRSSSSKVPGYSFS